MIFIITLDTIIILVHLNNFLLNTLYILYKRNDREKNYINTILNQGTKNISCHDLHMFIDTSI